MTAVLPLLRVKTRHSDYYIDQNEQTFIRVPRHARANDLSAHGIGPSDKCQYDEIHGPVVGQSMTVVVKGGGWLRSTPVEAVEEVTLP